MDFVSDGLADRRRLRCLNIVDDFTKECVAIEVDTSLPGPRVAAVLERLGAVHGLPRTVTVDNGPEFAGKVLDEWAWRHGLELRFIEPSAPEKCVYRELQRSVSRQVPRRTLVRLAAPCAGSDRGMATGVQRVATPQRTGLPDAA